MPTNHHDGGSTDSEPIDAELAEQLRDAIDALKGVRWADVVDVDAREASAFTRRLVEARSRLLTPRVITDGGQLQDDDSSPGSWEAVARERLVDDLQELLDVDLPARFTPVLEGLEGEGSVGAKQLEEARAVLVALERRLDDVAQAFGYSRWETGSQWGRLSDEEKAEVEARDEERELATDGGELLVDDVELPAEVAIGHRGSELLAMKAAVIEWLPRDEEPRVKLELYDDVLELDAYLDVEGAEQLRDRLDEVLAVIDEARS